MLPKALVWDPVVGLELGPGGQKKRFLKALIWDPVVDLEVGPRREGVPDHGI